MHSQVRLAPAHRPPVCLMPATMGRDANSNTASCPAWPLRALLACTALAALAALFAGVAAATQDLYARDGSVLVPNHNEGAFYCRTLAAPNGPSRCTTTSCVRNAGTTTIFKTKKTTQTVKSTRTVKKVKTSTVTTTNLVFPFPGNSTIAMNQDNYYQLPLGTEPIYRLVTTTTKFITAPMVTTTLTGDIKLKTTITINQKLTVTSYTTTAIQIACPAGNQIREPINGLLARRRKRDEVFEVDNTGYRAPLAIAPLEKLFSPRRRWQADVAKAPPFVEEAAAEIEDEEEQLGVSELPAGHLARRAPAACAVRCTTWKACKKTITKSKTSTQKKTSTAVKTASSTSTKTSVSTRLGSATSSVSNDSVTAYTMSPPDGLPPMTADFVSSTATKTIYLPGSLVTEYVQKTGEPIVIMTTKYLPGTVT